MPKQSVLKLTKMIGILRKRLIESRKKIIPLVKYCQTYYKEWEDTTGSESGYDKWQRIRDENIDEQRKWLAIYRALNHVLFSEEKAYDLYEDESLHDAVDRYIDQYCGYIDIDMDAWDNYIWCELDWKKKNGTSLD